MILNVKGLKGEDVLDRIFKYFNLSYEWNLQPRDFQVISKLFYRNHLLKKEGINEELRMESLFSKKGKDNLAEALDMSPAAVANTLSKLRRAGIISGNSLNRPFSSLNPDKEDFPFTIMFNVTGKKYKLVEIGE